MYFRQIFENSLSEGFGKDLSNISKGKFNMVQLVLGSKIPLSKKSYAFQDDFVEIKDQYEQELRDENYENIKIGFKNAEFTIMAIKYFDEHMSEKEMRKIVEKEIPTDLKIVSLFGKVS